jgi:hypothetical protein
LIRCILFSRWGAVPWRDRPPALEPTVVYGLDHFQISGICGFVNNGHFAPDEMPEALVKVILKLLKPAPDNPPLIDRTLQGGARYVIGVIRHRGDRRAQTSAPRSRPDDGAIGQRLLDCGARRPRAW